MKKILIALLFVLGIIFGAILHHYIVYKPFEEDVIKTLKGHNRITDKNIHCIEELLK